MYNNNNDDWDNHSQDNSDRDNQPQNNANWDNQPQNNANWDNQSQNNVNWDQSQSNYNFEANSEQHNTSEGQGQYQYQNHNQAYYKEIIVKPERNRNHKFLTYMSLVLITSIVTSFIVGGAMYSSFSKQLNEQIGSVQKTVAQVSTNGKKAATEIDSLTKSVTGTNLVTSTSPDDLTVTEIAKKVGPSIVGIKMTVPNSRQSSFFGSNSSTSDSEGSGIIISKDGYIMTNYHVVQYADPNSGAKNTTLTVYLPDKREAKATFVGGDSDNDLALIKVNLSDLPVAELGDSSAVEVGDPAVAIGNPLGMEFAGSVTYGVISALNRQLDTGDVTMNLIQTDAAINPGNSGGALVNSKGQVIAINSAKISVTGVEGLGFAIPINTAKPIVEQLKSYGYVKGKPLVGISAQEVSEEISSMYGIPVGVYITDVTAGGAAVNAGIKKGDVIIKLDGKEIKTMSDIDAIKKLHKAGDTVDVVVSRNGTNVTLKLKFTEAK
ncbi:MAG: S1C family serine protease [Ruminiclostridium sp.]